MDRIQDRATAFALSVRLFLASTGIASDVASWVEVSTPVSSRQRTREALWLAARGKSPYSGWPYHEPPLLLPLLQFTSKSDVMSVVPFVVADVMAAWALHQVQKQIPGTINLSAAYLLNPFTVLSCVGCSTRSFENCLVVIGIYAAMHRHVWLAAISLCCAVYIGLYPVLFLVPFAMLVVQKGGKKGCIDLRLLLFAFGTSACLLCILSCLYVSQFQEHKRHGILPSIADFTDWMHRDRDGPAKDADHWMLEVYGFAFQVEDLTPNLGLWWYFFTEMFPFYRPFFRFVFHSMSCIFSIPFSLSFPESPLFALLLQVITVSIFKPYPTVSDYALILALLLLFPDVIHRVNWWWFLIVSGALLSVLEPVMWHEWVQTESANANFYFSINLLIALWQILLMALLVDAQLKIGRKRKQD